MPLHSSQGSKKGDMNASQSSKSTSRGRSSDASANSRSLSPSKRRVKQPLHIRMDLTETQMDRITDAFTHKVSNSPQTTPSKSTVSISRTATSHEEQEAYQGYEECASSGPGSGMYRFRSPTFSDLMPRPSKADRLGLAERRQREMPSPLHLIDNRLPVKAPKRPQMEAISDGISPLSEEKEPIFSPAYDTEASIYSPPVYETRQVGGRGIQETPSRKPRPDVLLDIHEAYQEQRQQEYSSVRPVTPMSARVRSRSLDRAGDIERIRQLEYALSPPPPPLPKHSAFLAGSQIAQAQPPPRMTETPMFSPLALYFRGLDFPAVKKGEKTMIGQNGWLERTGKPEEKEKRTPSKRHGLIDSIKKIAKDMSELHTQTRRPQFIPKEPLADVTISLDTREQSLLYCELEFHLTSALNDFITGELDRGHLVADNLKKVADNWYQQGRPRVVGFRYDLETQLELVHLHIKDFSFYGRRQSNPAEIAGLLHAMKVNARSMRIRTFCQPDPVIAKHLVDAQSLFNMINVSAAAQIALAEVAQFFKVIIERERDARAQQALEKKRIIRGHSK